MLAGTTAGHSQMSCAAVLTLCCTSIAQSHAATLSELTHTGVRDVTATEHAQTHSML